MKRQETQDKAHKDELYLAIEKCKNEEGSRDPFLHSVRAAPDTQCVVACNWQLDNISKLCIDPNNFSVLGVDTTYNFGASYCTPTPSVGFY